MKARTTAAEKRARREVLRPDFDHVPTEAGAWSGGDERSDDRVAEALREAISSALTERQREIVEWHFFEGVSQCEIARRLGVTQQVVQKALYGVVRDGRPIGGALRKLREALTPTLLASA